MKRAVALAGAILLAALSPAVASAIRAQLVSVSCSATVGCVAGTNASTGTGVSGTSAAGRGVVGTSTGSADGMFAKSRYGVGFKSAAASGNAILAANSSATSPTVDAIQNGSGSALAGMSAAGGNGVSAISGAGTALAAGSNSGIGLSAISETENPVFANSARDWSLIAESSRGTGISAYAGRLLQTFSPAAIYAVSESGTAFRAQSSSGFAMLVESPGIGVRSISGGNGLDASGTYIGVIGRAPRYGYPFVAAVGGFSVFSVDGVGDVRYKGTLGSYARTAHGNVLAYGANATTPTVEDVGSARLSTGYVRIALEPAFARSIEGMGRYRIFLMPDGDTNGLFVSERDPAGFSVRETRGGHGSIAFDYRVVATTVGHGTERAAFVTAGGGPRTPLIARKPSASTNGRSR